MFPSVCAAVAALARAWITIGLPATAMACALPADPALATTAAELPETGIAARLLGPVSRASSAADQPGRTKPEHWSKPCLVVDRAGDGPAAPQQPSDPRLIIERVAERPLEAETDDAVDDHVRHLDGFLIGCLPAGLGPLTSDFTFEWEDVSHASRVWERRDDAGNYSVDLTIRVMRGERLRDPESLVDYLAEYHERDLGDWELEPFDVRGRTGYHDEQSAFWLEAPGVAVEVRIDPSRFSVCDLLRTARGVVPEPEAVGDQDES